MTTEGTSNQDVDVPPASMTPSSAKKKVSFPQQDLRQRSDRRRPYCASSKSSPSLKRLPTIGTGANSNKCGDVPLLTVFRN